MVTRSPQPYRQIILELCDAEASQHCDPDGQVDTVALRGTVFLRLCSEFPEVEKAFTAHARDFHLQALVDWYLRHAKRDFVIGRKADEVRHGQLRMFVRVPVGEKRYVARQRTALKKTELRLLAKYHEKMGTSHWREVAWCRWALAEMEALGLPEEASVSDLLAKVEEQKAA